MGATIPLPQSYKMRRGIEPDNTIAKGRSASSNIIILYPRSPIPHMDSGPSPLSKSQSTDPERHPAQLSWRKGRLRMICSVLKAWKGIPDWLLNSKLLHAKYCTSSCSICTKNPSSLKSRKVCRGQCLRVPCRLSKSPSHICNYIR